MNEHATVEKNVAEFLINHGISLQPKLQYANPDGCGPQIPYVILQSDDGQAVVPLPELVRKAPDRIRAVAAFRDVTAFSEYVLKYKTADAVIMAKTDVKGAKFTALLDYHGVGKPSPVTHLAVLDLTSTPEWEVWTKSENKEFSQTDFALFVEENQRDITAPTGAEMLEMAKSLQATQGVEFKSRIYLQNGDQAFTYDVNTAATAGLDGKMIIPSTFMLRLSPFVGCPEQAFECRFRYQLRRPTIVMGYVILRKVQEVVRLVKACSDIVAESTGLPVWEGEYTHK